MDDKEIADILAEARKVVARPVKVTMIGNATPEDEKLARDFERDFNRFLGKSRQYGP